MSIINVKTKLALQHPFIKEAISTGKRFYIVDTRFPSTDGQIHWFVFKTRLLFTLDSKFTNGDVKENLYHLVQLYEYLTEPRYSYLEFRFIEDEKKKIKIKRIKLLEDDL